MLDVGLVVLSGGAATLKKNKTRVNCVWQDVIGITQNKQHLDNF